ncbi:MAG: HEAT repeat domain-containing protein [Planctomycetota bacterium]|nr:HEAT repeat domain-containing protein [Planctomycetota bacterium]
MPSELIRNHSRFAVVLVALLTVSAHSVRAFDGPETSPAVEKQLLAILRSEAPAADKAIACKKLAIHGSAAAVPDLARLLPNPQLSSWARIALEAIPGEASNEALRTAADSLQGRLLVGTINSIGFRQDAKAVALLTSKLKDSDAEVASAAAVALGHIGDAAATKSLQVALATAPAKVRSAVAEGYVLCAERLHNDGQSAAAVKIYDEIRKADVPTQRVIEATRGAILARNQDGIPLLMETLQSANKKMFQLALGTLREFPGGDIDKALAAELVRATPNRAALIIQAMADRPETVVLAAILKAAETGERNVRMSAIDALKRVGDDSCLAALLELAADEDADVAQTAKETLAELPGQRVDAEIVVLLPMAKGKTYPLLLQLVGQRRIDAVDDVLKALDHPDQDVRNAALIALGETVSLKRLPLLISQAVTPKKPEDALVAQQALQAASVRMPDREACAAALASALDEASAASQTTLLEILSEVGGTNALQTLATSAKSDDPQLQDTSSRLLGKWNSVAAAPVLLDLAKTGPEEKYRIRALRGYIGLARKFAMPDKQRAEMCQNAFDATLRPAERKLVLDVLKLHPSPAGLTLAINATKVPALKSDATAAALVIAKKVGGKGVDVGKLLAGVGLEKVKLEIVKAEYGAGAKQKDVTAVLRKQGGDSPLITLASATYNTSFGGDPAPGVVKKLKVQYLINGKAGEASFAEDALILLPMPK